MPSFDSFAEFQRLLPEIVSLPFDDDRVEFDTIADKQLKIKFNNVEHKTKVDDQGKEREVFQGLVINNFAAFKIIKPDSGTHRLASVDEIEDGVFRFQMTRAEWEIKLDGPFSGNFEELVDDTDFEFSFSLGMLVLAAIAIICGILALFYFV